MKYLYIVKTYNSSFHKSIKQSPASVKEVDEYKIWIELCYKKNSIHSELNFKFKFNIHDTVRISILKHPLNVISMKSGQENISLFLIDFIKRTYRFMY